MSRKSVIVWNHRSTAQTSVIGGPVLDDRNYNEFNHVTNHPLNHVTNLPVTNSVASLPQDVSHHSAVPVVRSSVIQSTLQPISSSYNQPHHLSEYDIERFCKTQIEDQRLGYPANVDVSSVMPSSTTPSIPLTKISSTSVQSEASNLPSPIIIGKIIQETESNRNHLIGYPSPGLSGPPGPGGYPGLDEQSSASPYAIPSHYSDTRTETINTDLNDNQTPSSIGHYSDGVAAGLSGVPSMSGQFDEIPKSPDSVQSAFQKRIQDTLISTAEKQLESFRNQNHLQFSRLESISKHFNAGNDYNPSPLNFKVSPQQTMQSTYEIEQEEDDMAIGVARRKKGPVPKLLNNERCKVCGDRATGFHYNVVSCEGCKGFFRRATMETKVFRCKGDKVGHCMEDKFMQRKCKSCRFEACLKAGMKKDHMQKVKQKVPKDKSHLDPGQAKLLEIALIFWRLYNQGVSSVDIQQIFKQATSKTTKPNPKVRNVAQNMVTSVSKLEKHIPDWDTNPYSHEAKAQRWKHITCIAEIHKRFIRAIAEALPYFGQLVAETKKTLLDQATIELILLRAASCYDKQNNGVRSINGNVYNLQMLMQAGVSEEFASNMKSLMESISKMQLSEESFAILSILCLLSPDRGGNMCLRDRQQLNRLQEIFANILKLQLLDNDVKSPIVYSKILMVLTRLREISFRTSDKFNSRCTQLTTVPKHT